MVSHATFPPYRFGVFGKQNSVPVWQFVMILLVAYSVASCFIEFDSELGTTLELATVSSNISIDVFLNWPKHHIARNPVTAN